MASNAGRAAGSPSPLPPLSEQLARRLLRAAAGESSSPEDLAVPATVTYVRLRTRLAVFLGDQGFAALWWRAIALARRAFPAWEDNAADETSSLPPGLHSALHSGSATETYACLLATFTNFLALLFTFIGEDLGTRLIYKAWPDLPPDAADLPAEGATP